MDREYDNRSTSSDVYISYLRDKIYRPFGTHAIETVRVSATGCGPTAGAEAPLHPESA